MNFRTDGELMRAYRACRTEDDAKEVIWKAEEDDGKYARQHIWYLVDGVEPWEERERLCELFESCREATLKAGVSQAKVSTPEETYVTTGYY